MCKKTKGIHNRIDKCMKPLIRFLNDAGTFTIASCCGHGMYPMTIVTRHFFLQGHSWELLSHTDIPRKKKIYKKDKQGYYYIPEVLEKGK
jgi:23S rRNA G2069 N7-methylase RlmK/C1962 C5-methylase RlmI